MKPYYEDEFVTLHHGSTFEVLPRLGLFDACVTDPPYGQTSIDWDRWPDGWPALVAAHVKSLWCFGTMRMFLDRQEEFGSWKFAQDVVWRKTRASTVATDRFRRQHEIVAHFYQGDWSAVHTDLPKRLAPEGLRNKPGDKVNRPPSAHAGTRVFGGFKEKAQWVDDGLRFMTSVIDAEALSSTARRYSADAVNPTQKPIDLLQPLIEYSVPTGGVVLDIFAGSGSTGVAARLVGRRAVLIELREEQCEVAARRLERINQVAHTSDQLNGTLQGSSDLELDIFGGTN